MRKACTLLLGSLALTACGQSPNRPASLFFIGDSITAAGQWAQRFPGDFVSQCAKPGADSAEIVSRCTPEPDRKPEIVFIMMGTNSILHGLSDAEVIGNFESLIKAYQGSAIVLQSILPTDQSQYGQTNPTARILSLNSQIAKLASLTGAMYLDLYPLFSDQQGNARLELFKDGEHPNDAGYAIWVNAINQVLAQAGRS